MVCRCLLPDNDCCDGGNCSNAAVPSAFIGRYLTQGEGPPLHSLRHPYFLHQLCHGFLHCPWHCCQFGQREPFELASWSAGVPCGSVSTLLTLWYEVVQADFPPCPSLRSQLFLQGAPCRMWMRPPPTPLQFLSSRNLRMWPSVEYGLGRCDKVMVDEGGP